MKYNLDEIIQYMINNECSASQACKCLNIPDEDIDDIISTLAWSAVKEAVIEIFCIKLPKDIEKRIELDKVSVEKATESATINAMSNIFGKYQLSRDELFTIILGSGHSGAYEAIQNILKYSDKWISYILLQISEFKIRDRFADERDKI